MTGNSNKPIITVAVCAPVERLYTYYVPYDLRPDVKTGKRVLAPFNNREVIGYIIDTVMDLDYSQKINHDIEFFGKGACIAQGLKRRL